MATINFTMASPDEADTVTLQGHVQQVHLFCKQNSTYWFYIPRHIIKTLRLQPSQDVYYYVVDSTTLMLSFRNPYLKKAKKRKIGYAGIDKDLTLVIPGSLVTKDFLKTKKTLRLINTTGSMSYEWQIQFL